MKGWRSVMRLRSLKYSEKPKYWKMRWRSGWNLAMMKY